MKTRIGNWFREQGRYFRWWREHRKEIVKRTRSHTLKGIVFYFFAVGGLIILAVTRPSFDLAIISVVGLAILMFGSLAWIAKQDSKVIKQLKKESNYNSNR
jgi:hypothetical protein